MAISSSESKPNFRRLHGYSFDPSLSVSMDTAVVNKTVFKIIWEGDLKPGPVGEYLEVVDYDPASQCFYEPVDLNCEYILAQDGLPPSESNPQFHQQMVYAVAMTTIRNFEKALGRTTIWSAYDGRNEGDFIQRLRIYPHALRQPNAYYSPSKKSLLFGYFPASAAAASDQFPGGLVFTCLSHDVIAHETTHALLDGMFSRFVENNHPDTLAFHEAFADIVALFQHFTFPDVLRHQIARTRGDLASQNLLGELAQQFGKAIGRYGALRNYINVEPDPAMYQEKMMEPHGRGAILVSAIFEAFIAIYKCRVGDLIRIATNGTGILNAGEIHPDLVNRLAGEAAKTAQQVLNMCIRALDYCPTFDITFGDYLRAIITADTDLVPDDDLGYRVAFIEAFRRRGIYPDKIRTLSEESLCWEKQGENAQQGIFKEIAFRLRDHVFNLDYLDTYPPDGLLNVMRKKFTLDAWARASKREKIFYLNRAARVSLHGWIAEYEKDDGDIRKFEEITGLYLKEWDTNPKDFGIKSENKKYKFEIHSFKAVRRLGPDGNLLNQAVISITQKRELKLDESNPDSPMIKFRGGCTLILNLDDLTLQRIIRKNINDDARLKAHREYIKKKAGSSLYATYFSDEPAMAREQFAMLHDPI